MGFKFLLQVAELLTERLKQKVNVLLYNICKFMLLKKNKTNNCLKRLKYNYFPRGQQKI